MSSYIHFYLRDGDRFLPIKTASRSSEYYNYFEPYAPYGKVAPLRRPQVDYVRADIVRDIEDLRSQQAEVEQELSLIPSFNNDLSEKIEAIRHAQDCLSDCAENLASLEQVKQFSIFLEDILDEAAESHYAEDERFHINPDEYIYVGIECGYPTTADIAAP